MAQVHERRKMNCSALFLCLLDDLSFASDYRLSPCWQVLQFPPLLVDCGVSVRNLHCMEYENKFVHKIVMTQRIQPRLSHVIFMIFVLSLSSALSDGFVGFTSACMFSCCPSPLVVPPSPLCRRVHDSQFGCCWPRNFYFVFWF